MCSGPSWSQGRGGCSRSSRGRCRQRRELGQVLDAQQGWLRGRRRTAAEPRVASLLVVRVIAWAPLVMSTLPLRVVASIASTLLMESANVATLLLPVVISVALVPAVAPAIAITAVSPAVAVTTVASVPVAAAREVTPRSVVASAIVGTPWRTTTIVAISFIPKGSLAILDAPFAVAALERAIEATSKRAILSIVSDTLWLPELKVLEGDSNLNVVVKIRYTETHQAENVQCF